jgi:5'-nucleotidase (lipoprotein e(P4) family)
MRRPFRRAGKYSTALTAVVFLAGCVSRPATRVNASPIPPPRAFPNDIRWFRTSAEYRALARQTYQLAADRLPELTRGAAPQSWAVILDADETVLDNSEYQRRRALDDSAYTEASWSAWVNEQSAAAIPGSPEFTHRVHALTGRVVIVTNRSMALCDATRANLQAIHVEADYVLCQPPGESDKNPRFRRVQDGTAVPGLAPLMVVEWIGDNILDFPGMTQDVRNDPAAFSEFGKRYFILPNPMYGSWQQIREP